jgi:hypothetical protein
LGTHKVKEGMACSSCNYVFALNPKEKPYLTDYAVKKVIDGLSGPDHLYFTYNQLYTQVHKIIQKKAWKNGFASLLVGVPLFIVIVVLTSGELLFALLFLEAAFLAALGYYLYRRTPHVRDETVKEVIRKYIQAHPCDRMVDGNAFKEIEPKRFDKEIIKYAPERLLIVERDDLADMLLLNRFPMEQKTLVVSASKYPKRAFEAFRHFAKKNPEIPIAAMHDLSRDGLKMKERLLADPSWNLEGREIQDLGLFPQDVDRVKAPLWRPTTGAGRPIDSLKPRGTAEENIAQGFRMPVDTAPPRAMLAMTALAVVAGAVLLSEAFLAQQAAQAGPQSAKEDGGFG